MKEIREITSKMKECEAEWWENMRKNASQCAVSPTTFILRCASIICNVPFDAILSKSNVVTIVQARWFFWAALRDVQHDTYSNIATLSSEFGHKFTTQTVGRGITTMYNMIYTEEVWRKRWSAMIKILEESSIYKNDKPTKHKVTITIPRELANTVEFKIDVKD